MSTWGKHVHVFSSLGAGNKETQPQFQCFRICIVTSLCPRNEGCRFFLFFNVSMRGKHDPDDNRQGK